MKCSIASSNTQRAGTSIQKRVEPTATAESFFSPGDGTAWLTSDLTHCASVVRRSRRVEPAASRGHAQPFGDEVRRVPHGRRRNGSAAQLSGAGEILETTLGWPPSDGADVTILGSGMAGLIEVLDVPEALHKIAPEGLAALSFMADDYTATLDRAREFAGEVTALDTGVPGVDLFICTVGGVPMEFMGSYQADAMES